MTLTEGFVRDQVFIDFALDVLFGEDQVNISHPCRFPTVTFKLMATYGLNTIADRIRVDLGYTPMHPLGVYSSDEMCDPNGWYSFYIGINGFSDRHVDSCIEFVVENSDSVDNDQRYSIDLTEEEQNVLWERLNAQCNRYISQNCDELLADAKKKMEVTE